MASGHLTADEIVGVLRRTTLPTVVVEGDRDVEVFRFLEECDSAPAMNALPCGGREALLAVFRRRAEFSDRVVAFLADSDMWLFTGIPRDCSEFVTTRGYSIENDIFAGSSHLLRLLTPQEQGEFDGMIRELARWFAFVVSSFLLNSPIPCDIHVRRLCPTGPTLSPEYLSSIGFKEADVGLVEDIQKNYALKLRGKQVFDVLVRLLGRPKRVSVYRRANLLEIAVKDPDNRLVDDILRAVGSRLSRP